MVVRLVPRGFRAMLLAFVLLTGLVPLAPAASIAAAPASAPTGLSPSGGTIVNGNPVLSWDAVTGATRYRVQVSYAPDFSSVPYDVTTVEQRATPTFDLALGPVYWRVAGMDSQGNTGPWGQTQFTRTWSSAPVPQYPSDGAHLSFPTDALRFTWSGVPNAQYYELQVDDAADFVGAQTYTTKTNSYVITEPKTSGQSFYWHVRAVSTTQSVVSSWSPTRQADVTWPGTPVLLYPANNASIDAGQGSCTGAVVGGQQMGCDLYFEWSPVLGAMTYQLQVSRDSNFANNSPIDVTVKGTRFAAPTGLNNGNYYWRVRALDAAGPQNYGPWSNASGLALVFDRKWFSRPTLLQPANYDVDLEVPRFEWTPVDHAAWYQVEIDTDSNFGVNPRSCYTNHTTFVPYHLLNGVNVVEPGSCDIYLQPGTTYFWHVRGIDAPVLNPGATYPLGILGLWSNQSNADVWRFQYMLPSPVVPSCDLADPTIPTLRWDDAGGAVKYQVTLLDKNDSTVASATTYSTSWTPTNLLSTSGNPYRWFVQSYDMNGRLSAEPARIDQCTFSISTFTATGSTPTQTFPPDASRSADMPALTWESVVGATNYQVWYSVHGSTTEAPLGPKTANLSYTWTDGILSAGTYDWRVKAYGSGGNQIAVSPSFWTFVIEQFDVLVPSDYLSPPRCVQSSTCTPVPDTATLHWNSIPGATWYTVYVAVDPEFTNIYRTYETPYTWLTPRDSWYDNQANQAYYWFVRPSRDGNTGRYDSDAFVNASAYQKRSEPIHLVSPADNANVADEVTFSWQDFLTSNQSLPQVPQPITQEAKQYRIQVSTVADFATVLDDKTVDETFFTEYDTTYPEGPLYWRVQAIDGSNNPLTWSATRKVNKASPQITLTSPAHLATVTTVPFVQWTPQAFAASYDVEIARNGDTNFLNSNQVTMTNTKMASYAHTEPLSSGDYAWHVRRVDANGRRGPWSAARVFHLVPTAPTPVAPANGSAVGDQSTLVLQWSSSQAYPQYIVETSAASNFASIKESRNTVMPAWAPLDTYAPGTYYWRVKAVNSSGQVVATSAAWSFRMPLPTDSLALSATLSQVSGTAFSLTVTAQDSSALKTTGYRGRIHFTSSDTRASLPGDYTFTSADAGVHTFSVTLRTYGSQSITATDTTTSTVKGTRSGIVVSWPSASYTAITPRRVLDTRPTVPSHNPTNIGLAGKFTAGTVRKFGVAGAQFVGGTGAAVPSTAVAITGNLTVVGQTAAGVVDLGPTVSSGGSTTTINFLKGEVRANNVTVGLANDGSLQAVYRASSGATTDLILDVTGYFLPGTSGALYHSLAPGRVLDTRPTTSTVTHIGPLTKLPNRIAKTFPVAGVKALGWSSALVPSTAVAVTGNVTVTASTSAGYVAIGPTMTSSPSTSTANVSAGANVANGVTVALSGGKLSVVWCGTTGSSADVIFDVTGYFTASSGGGLSYHAVSPARLVDSSRNLGLSGSFVNRTARLFTVGGKAQVPTDAKGISGNLTVLSSTSGGWALISPEVVSSPQSSTVNVMAGHAEANGFDVALGTSAHVAMMWAGTTTSTAQVALDVTGYWK